MGQKIKKANIAFTGSPKKSQKQTLRPYPLMLACIKKEEDAFTSHAMNKAQELQKQKK